MTKSVNDRVIELTNEEHGAKLLRYVTSALQPLNYLSHVKWSL